MTIVSVFFLVNSWCVMVNHENIYIVLKKVFPLDKPSDGDLFYTRKDFSLYEGNILKNELDNLSWEQLQNKKGRDKLARLFGVEKKFSFLTSLGFAYYLPAFITYMLLEEDYEFLQFCLFNVLPGESELSLNRVGEIYSFLSQEQIDVFKASLFEISELWRKWGVEENMAKIAIRDYWDYV